MAVLYRKYRPKVFNDVVGQKHITTILENEILHDSLAHAYMFVGPRGTGKTTLARILARAVNCTNRKKNSAEPCNTCDSCTQILSERYLDVIEIDAATHTQVDNVRDTIIQSVHVPPIHENGYKVFIIDEVHMLSKHAFNALLKTIEEPPANVLFLLATTELHKVPETILSRCEQFNLKLVSTAPIIERLQFIAKSEKISVPDVTFEAIARQAKGSLRDAETLLGQVLSAAEKGKVSEKDAAAIVPQPNWQSAHTFINHTLANEPGKAIEVVHEQAKQGIDPKFFTEDVIEYTRYATLLSVDEKLELPIDPKTKKGLLELASTYKPEELHLLLRIATASRESLAYASIDELPLEMTTLTYSLKQNANVSPPGDNSTDQQKKEQAKTKVEKSELVDSQKPANDEQLFTALSEKWPQLLVRLKDINHSLAVFLKVGHPISASGDSAIIGFQFDFHADTVRDKKNRTSLEQALTDVTGYSLRVDCVVDPDYTANHQKFNGSSEPEVQDILEVMGGGEVV